MNSQHDPGWQAGNGCNKDCFCMLFAFLINHLTVRQTPASAAHKSDFTQRETLKEGASGQEGSVQFKCRLAWTWSLCDRWLRVSVCVCGGKPCVMDPWHTSHLTSFLWAQRAAAHTPPQPRGLFSQADLLCPPERFTLCSSADDTVTRRPCNLGHCTVMKDESRRGAHRAERRTGKGAWGVGMEWDEEEMQISGRVIYDLILCSPCLL